MPEIPKTDITFDEAVSLLIKSAAMEEISLSKLLEAEKNNIVHILNCPGLCPRDIIEINNTVDRTVKDILQLQMLLQFKLENVEKLLKCRPGCPCPDEKRAPCIPCKGYKVTGKAKGTISDGFNEYYKRAAEIDFTAADEDLKQGCVSYKTEGENSLSLKAGVREITIGEDVIIFKGEGNCVKNGKEGCVRYILMVYCLKEGIKSFDIIIMSKNTLFQHRSGIITANCCELDIC